MKIHECNFCGCVTNKPIVVDSLRTLGCPSCAIPYAGWYDPVYTKKKKKTTYKRGSIGKTIRAFILNRDNCRCLKCGSKGDLTMDHITPVCKGGKGIKENLQTLCKPCNQNKGALVIDYRN